jgi:hypothetical protein
LIAPAAPSEDIDEVLDTQRVEPYAVSVFTKPCACRASISPVL